MLHYKVIMIILIASFFVQFSFSQDAETAVKTTDATVPDAAVTDSSSEFLIIEDVEGGKRTINQRFIWEYDENVLKYDFILEEKNAETGEWEEKEKLSVEGNTVDVNLPPGEFRYKVVPYNFLGIEEEEFATDYVTITIKKTYDPEIDDASPSMIYLEEENDGEFNVSGKDFIEGDTKFYLKSLNLLTAPTLFPLAADIRSRTRATVKFDDELFDSVDYVLVAENPGGLTAESPLIRVKFKKAMDFDISVGYMPMYNAFDDTLSNYYNTRFFPLSAGTRLSFIPVKRRFGYFGVALGAYYSHLSNQTGWYKLTGELLETNLMFVYQAPVIKGKFIIDLHAGGGVMWFLNQHFEYSHDVKSDILTTFYPSLSGGCALQFYVMRRMYIEVGADISFAVNIMQDSDGGTSDAAGNEPLYGNGMESVGLNEGHAFFLTVRPQISIGWQF